jgi:hypothetical protein
MATTAGDQINAALRLIGMLAEGETPSSNTSNDALNALNQMIDSWNTERLSVFSTQDQIVSWLPNTYVHTLGPTGDTVGNRPILVDDASYFRDPQSGISFGIKLINQQQYNGIAVKTVTSTYPQVMWVNMEYPDITMTVYPVPTKLLEFHIVSVNELTTPAVLATNLTFPPGYLRCFKYNLACEIATEFGIAPPANVARLAMTSKRNLKRINNPDDIMSLPYSIVATRQRYNIFAGNY